MGGFLESMRQHCTCPTTLDPWSAPLTLSIELGLAWLGTGVGTDLARLVSIKLKLVTHMRNLLHPMKVTKYLLLCWITCYKRTYQIYTRILYIYLFRLSVLLSVVQYGRLISLILATTSLAYNWWPWYFARPGKVLGPERFFKQQNFWHAYILIWVFAKQEISCHEY